MTPALLLIRLSSAASERIALAAFQYAERNNRTRVTAVHKANVCKQADGLFLRSCAKVASSFPHIKFDDHLVCTRSPPTPDTDTFDWQADSLLTKLVQDPSEYDVLLCPNLFGDLVSDLAAGLVGSLGLMPSGQYSETYAAIQRVSSLVC